MSGFIPNVPKPVSWLLKASIAVACIFLVIHKVPWKTVYPTLGKCNFWFILLSIALQYAVALTSAIRWKILLQHTELSLKKFLYFVFLGQFFNLFLPTYIAAEAIKVYAFGKKYGGTQENVGISLLTKFSGMIVQIFMGGFGLLLFAKKLKEHDLFSHIKLSTLAFSVGVPFIILALLLFWYWRDKIKTQAWYQTILSILKNRKLFYQNLLLTTLIQFLAAASSYFLFLSLWPDTHFWEVVLFTTIILGMLSLPFGFGGVGVREYLNLLLFTDVGGIPSHVTFAVNIVGYIPVFTIALTGGLWMTIRKLKN